MTCSGIDINLLTSRSAKKAYKLTSQEVKQSFINGAAEIHIHINTRKNRWSCWLCPERQTLQILTILLPPTVWRSIPRHWEWAPCTDCCSGHWEVSKKFNRHITYKKREAELPKKTPSLIFLAGTVKYLKGWITLEIELAIWKIPLYTGDFYSWHPHTQALISSDCMLQQAAGNCLIFSQLAKPQRLQAKEMQSSAYATHHTICVWGSVVVSCNFSL